MDRARERASAPTQFFKTRGIRDGGWHSSLITRPIVPETVKVPIFPPHVGIEPYAELYRFDFHVYFRSSPALALYRVFIELSHPKRYSHRFAVPRKVLNKYARMLKWIAHRHIVLIFRIQSETRPNFLELVPAHDSLEIVCTVEQLIAPHLGYDRNLRE